jgi:LPPG:FO 2-phospho-L-lactate transferase
LDTIDKLKGPTWFKLGDQDLGLHLERTRRLNNGDKLSAITRDFCENWGIGLKIFPMTDQPVSTMVITENMGVLPFQEYFVRYQYSPQVSGFNFMGVERAFPAEGVEEILENADCIVLCPSNPFVSIDPILSIAGIYERVEKKKVIAVSPIISGKAIKGPAAKMYLELGQNPSASTVAKHYKNILDGFVIDRSDEAEAQTITKMNIEPLVTNIIMNNRVDRARLAREVCQFCEKLLED